MKMRILILIFMVAFIGNSSLKAQEFTYVGANKCKMCHNKVETGGQYAQWVESRHSKAMESLSATEALDPKCNKCHSTHGSVKIDLVTGLKVTEGVSCESCHGPGSAYFPNAIMKSREASMAKGLILPTEKVCVTCHNPESKHYKGFNYKEALAKVAHPKPAA
ncbi:MAG TPA: hypothetical protein DCG69_03310 [Bacteroidales bacterium]|nr:hypothetical protein [Bacteroidales bacterium]